MLPWTLYYITFAFEHGHLSLFEISAMENWHVVVVVITTIGIVIIIIIIIITWFEIRSFFPKFPSISPNKTGIISYPLFADADTGIYPHAASHYHARPKAKRGIAMLSVDKFPYPRKQTRGNEFIPCSTIFVTLWNVSAALKSQLSY